MIFFYTLSILCLVSCTLLVISRNPVYSLLNLVILFICGSLHLLYLGVDFLAYVFVIVYVGALAVLFLFVVIMLDIKLSKLKNFKTEIPLILGIASLCFLYLDSHELVYENLQAFNPRFSHVYDDFSCIKALGSVLYTHYVIHFVLCGLVLLVAMIGAIVLTSKGRYQANKEKEKQFKQCERFHSIGKNKSSFQNEIL
jgi:NADH-quinone oxidoreductase subunit J